MSILDQYRVRADMRKQWRAASPNVEQAKADAEKLLQALEAVMAGLEDRAEQYRATSDRLNQEVMDKHPDKDAKAAMRYSSYASNAEATLHAARGRIAMVLV